MKHSLHYLLIALFLLMGFQASNAENIVYGVGGDWTGTGVLKYDLDALNPNQELDTEQLVALPIENTDDVLCGVSVGDKYYTFMRNSNYEVVFATINFTTGNIVEVNNYAYKNGKKGSMMGGMAYDKANDILYGIETGYNDEGGKYSNVYRINPTTGEISDLATINGHQLCAIACDSKGSVYLVENTYIDWTPYPQLYRLNADNSLETVVENKDVAGMASYTCSALFSADDSKLYFHSYQDVGVFDLNAKTYSVAGSVNKPIAGLTYTLSTEDGVAAEKPASKLRFLVNKSWYGDHMGFGTDRVMTKEDIYYNSDNKQSIVIKSGRDLDTNRFSTSDYTQNEFNAEGKIVSSTHYQFGSYDFGDWAREKRSETIYTYDEAGNLVKEVETYYNAMGTSSSSIDYTYDEAGNVATKTITTQYDVVTLTYLDYENGLPTAYTSEGKYDGDNFTAMISYDANGNKIEEDHLVYVYDEEFGNPSPVTKQVELWEYDEQSNPLSYIKYTFNENGQHYASAKTVYEFVNGSKDLIRSEDFTSFDGEEWYSNGIPCYMQYADFEDKAEMVAVQSLASLAEEGINCVNVDFTVPEAAFSGSDPKAIIFRDGAVVDTIGIIDHLDYETYAVRYTDKDVYNGKHDYFVQPLIEEGYDEAGNTIYKGYNISAPSSIELNTELPAATDLRLSSARSEKNGSGLTATTLYYGTISWTNPETLTDFGFISNDLMLGNAQLCEETSTTKDASVTAIESSFDTDIEVYILTRYKYGKAQSEKLTVSLSDLKSIATGIHGASTEAISFSISDRTLRLNGQAKVTIFSANGQQAATMQGAGIMSLDQLSNGTYVICVEHNGEVKAYKYQVK
ncbi:MAG: hypothetical protein SPF39_08185 [Prevotella sp.]|nr:hypothetical protein [Prevotella sp.]